MDIDSLTRYLQTDRIIVEKWDNVIATSSRFPDKPFPIRSGKERVICITLQRSNDSRNVNLFAYDEWADLFAKLRVGTKVTIFCNLRVFPIVGSLEESVIIIDNDLLTPLCSITVHHKDFKFYRNKKTLEIFKDNLSGARIIYSNDNIFENVVKLSELDTNFTKQSINVMGAILHYTRPKRTTAANAKDRYSMSFNIIDLSTLSTFPSSFTVLNIFGNDLDKFPRPFSIGDVIRCHRVSMQKYMGRLQLIGNMRNTSVVTFHRRRENILTDIFSTSSPGPSPVPTIPYPQILESAAPSPSAHPGLSPAEWLIHSTPTNAFSYAGDIAQAVQQTFTQVDQTLARSSLYDETSEGSITKSLYRPLLTVVTTCFPSTVSTAAGANVDRLDTCALVLQVFRRTSTGADTEEGTNITSFVVWDGSTPGRVDLRDPSLLSACCILDSRPGPSPNTIIAEAFKVAVAHTHITEPNSVPNLAGLQQASTNPNELLGCAVLVELADIVCAEWPTMLQPGMWVKLRNVAVNKPHINVALANNDIYNYCATTPIISIKPDSHINIVWPHFRDVKDIIKKYALRLPAPIPPVCRARNAMGFPYTPMALMQATVAPFQFCTNVEIISWRPRDISKFLCEIPAAVSSSSSSPFSLPSLRPESRSSSSSSSSPSRRRLLFSVKVRDSTAEQHVIFVGEDAEIFLGCTAEEFGFPAKQQDILQRLQSLTTTSPSQPPVFLDFFINSYRQVEPQVQTHEEQGRDKLALLSHQPPKKKAKTNYEKHNNNSSCSSSSSSSTGNEKPKIILKRFRGFNTKLFE